MAQIKPQKFTIESFKEQASWIGNLFGPLNQFLNDLFIMTSNNISIADNLFQEIKEIRFTNSAVSFPLSFKPKFTSQPKGMQVIYIFDNTLGKCATQFPVVEWQYLNGNIRITAMTGLTASTNYTIRFLVIYG